MPTPQEILQYLAQLTDGQRTLILEMSQYLKIPIERQILDGSDIAVPSFIETFENRLLLHHATNDDKLKKKAFEFAFKRASQAAGKVANIVSSQTNPGADVIVDGVHFSCKTEGSSGIHPTRLTISKLMEARWIRECRTSKDFARSVSGRVAHHLQQYERIISLRGISQPVTNSVFYELLEIPLDVLRACGSLMPRDFLPRTKSGGSAAWVSIRGKRVFRLILDGSVEKVTITNLNRDQCICHAEWTVPLPIMMQEEGESGDCDG
jgi:Type II site-specific deoxyribonuclease